MKKLKYEDYKDFIINSYNKRESMASIGRKIGTRGCTVKRCLIHWGAYEGVKWKTIKKICEENGVSYDSVRHRRERYGITTEEAIYEVKNRIKRPKNNSIYAGCMKHKCLEAGVSYKAVFSKMKFNEIPLEEAIYAVKNKIYYFNKKPRVKKVKVKEKVLRKKKVDNRTIDGLSLAEYAEKYNMKLDTVKYHWRILNGK